MKISIITPSVYNPTRNEIDTGIESFDIRKLYAIINMSQGEIVYATASNTKGFNSVDGSVVNLQYDISSHSDNDIIQILYEDNTETKILETILYFISSMVEKMPRVDDRDRQIVSVETGTVGVSSLPTLANVTTLNTVQNFAGGNTSAIPTHMANAGASYIYDQIIIS